MSEKHKAPEKEVPYFLTFTIVEWLDVLADDDFKMIVIDAVKFYQENGGLVVFAYCIMPNHVHMIAQAESEKYVSEILRDIKKYSSRKIAGRLQAEDTSRNMYFLSRFQDAGSKLKRITNLKVWQDGNRPLALYTNKFLWQKLDYIHNNPVVKGLVANAEDYFFSSARNYVGLESVLDVELIGTRTRTV